MDLEAREIINHIMLIKRNIFEISRDRLYVKNFANILIQYLYELEDLAPFITVEILQVMTY